MPAMYHAFFPYVLGILLSWITLSGAARMGGSEARRFLTLIIAIVIAGFVGFPLEMGHRVAVMYEIGAIVVLGALTAASIRSSALLLGAAWFGHGLWDLLHIVGASATDKPLWVTQVCVPYDWIGAAWIVWRRPGDAPRPIAGP